MDTKGFLDSIHGFIDLDPLLVKVIDTPQFQRLRNIKQLGGKYHVYPGACHNRFEHSIGTCYLAGKLARHLQDQQRKDGMKEYEELFITDTDILCVELAGLCHDLGHGPFSHLFDGQFMRRFPDNDGNCWKHEKGSCDMIDHMIEENGKLEKLFDNKLDNDDIKFIKEMINPPGNAKDYKEKPNKPFLYEIISNKKNEVDVDKWDYLARDCHHLGKKNTFDHNRYISLTKVVKCDGKREKDEYHIAVRDKERRNLYEMFHVRDYLHKSVYQHDVGNAVEEMIADALFLADKHVIFKGRNDQGELEEFTISEAVKNMEAYEKLNDSVLDMILSQDAKKYPDLEKAQNILKRVHARDFYRRFGRPSFSSDQKMLCERAKEKFEEIFERKKKENKNLDCFVILKKFNFGFKDQDPVKKCWFFTKESPKVPTKLDDDVSKMLPKIFQEFQLVVYNKTSKKDLNDGLKNEEEKLLKDLQDEWKKLEKKYKEKEFSETFLNAWNKLEEEDEENGFLNELKNAWKMLGKEGEQKNLPKFLQIKLENFEKKDKKIKLLKDLQAKWEKLKKENKQKNFQEYVRKVWKKLDKDGAEENFPKYLQAAWQKLKKENKQLFEDLRNKILKEGGENELSEYFQEELEKLEN